MAPRAGLDRQAVVAAAVALIDAEGLEALSLGRLAERLGVKPPSLYKHVAGLAGLRHGVAAHGMRDLARRLGHAAIGRSGDAALVALANAYRRYARAHPGLYTLTLQAPDPGDPELVGASEEVLAVLRAVLAPYGLDAAATVHAIRGFRAIVHGFVALELAGGFGLPVDVDASFDHLVAHFVRGLRPPQPERSHP